MPYHKSCLKNIRQNKTRQERNRQGRSRLRSAISQVLESTTKESAAKALTGAFSTIDKSAKNGLIHKNNAANQKSRLSKVVSKLVK